MLILSELMKDVGKQSKLYCILSAIKYIHYFIQRWKKHQVETVTVRETIFFPFKEVLFCVEGCVRMTAGEEDNLSTAMW